MELSNNIPYGIVWSGCEETLTGHPSIRERVLNPLSYAVLCIYFLKNALYE